MPEATDLNAAVWQSDDGISHWLSGADERERRWADQRLLMAALLPFADDATFTFLDLGAGTGAASRVLLERYEGSTAILADFSPQMIDEGARALEPHAGRFRYVAFDLGQGAWPAAIPEALDAVVSSLCVHHLPDERKRGLFAEICSRLVPGGWYLNFDPVRAGDDGVAEAWERAQWRLDPVGSAKRADRAPEQQVRYENHVRHMSPLGPQLQFMVEAGFDAVDVYWKQLDYVIFGGRRPLVS